MAIVKVGLELGKVEGEWLEFCHRGPVSCAQYRANLGYRLVQFWSDYHVPGLAKMGWNITHSATVGMHARKMFTEAGRPWPTAAAPK